jgi:hypothetical protein
MEKRTTNGTASADYSLKHNFLQRTVNETKNGLKERESKIETVAYLRTVRDRELA